MATINTIQTQFDENYATAQQMYSERALNIPTELYNKEKLAILNRITSYDVLSSASSNILNTYQAMTDFFIEEIVRFKDMVDYAKSQISETDQASLNYIVKDALCTIGGNGKCNGIDYDCNGVTSITSIYISNTDALLSIKQSVAPTALNMFIDAHENFKSRIDEFKNIADLKLYWEEYNNLYNTATQTLTSITAQATRFDQSVSQNMINVCGILNLQYEVPKASNYIRQYTRAMHSSANILGKRAQLKRAGMCSCGGGNGWWFWFIIFILLAAMIMLFYNCDKSKSSRNSMQRLT